MNLLYSFFLLTTINCFGFNYSVTFSGTGLSSHIDSIVIKNISQNTTVTLFANNNLNLTDEITSIENKYDADNQINIYPNFEEGKSTLSYNSNQSCETQITSNNFKMKMLSIII